MLQMSAANLKASVIISVYNRFDFLELVLAGLSIQSEKNFEVIISDDGSGSVFVKALKAYMSESPLQIRHNWHEDQGFRKNRILNLSVSMASAPYLIFIDGDCIPHPRFVEAHLAYATPGVCLAGRRVDLSAGITKRLSGAFIRKGGMQTAGMTFAMFVDFLRMRLFHLMNGLYIRNGLLRRFLNRKERNLLGANFSLYKQDLLSINGFDERYQHPTYGEDSDVELRLRRHGFSLKSLLSIAVMYHCHHPLLPRPEESRKVYEIALQEKTAYTPYGIIRQKSQEVQT